MNITFKTLTPIWTGDIDNKSVKILENGILGSLRWWSEAINRGFDYAVCDPTNETRCPDENQKYCYTCHIFGSTGRRRLFKMYCDGGESLFQRILNIRPVDRNRGWYYPGSGLVGNISILITPFDVKKFKKSFICLPLIIASKWGAIGAKIQLGYGVINPIQIPELNYNQILHEYQSEYLPNIKHSRQNVSFNYPNIKDMFFCKIKFHTKSDDWWKACNGIKNWNNGRKNFRGLINDRDFQKWIQQGIIPVAPAIKDWLRFHEGINLFDQRDRNTPNFIFLYGESRNNQKKSSKINISCAYCLKRSNWEFRLWGWIPKSNRSPLKNRDLYLNNLKNCLNGSLPNLSVPWKKIFGSKIENPQLITWREFDSPRDTVQIYENYPEFIQSLIAGEEVK